jgi:hypothetical protein
MTTARHTQILPSRASKVPPKAALRADHGSPSRPAARQLERLVGRRVVWRGGGTGPSRPLLALGARPDNKNDAGTDEGTNGKHKVATRSALKTDDNTRGVTDSARRWTRQDLGGRAEEGQSDHRDDDGSHEEQHTDCALHGQPPPNGWSSTAGRRRRRPATPGMIRPGRALCRRRRHCGAVHAPPRDGRPGSGSDWLGDTTYGGYESFQDS